MLLWKVRLSCSSVMSRMSSSGCCSPALLTRMSTPPSSSTTFATDCSQKAFSPRSPRTMIALRPSASTSFFVFAKVEDRDIGSFAREQDRDGAADAAVGTGNDRYLAVEASGPGVAGFPIGFGFEVGLAAGQAILVDHRLDCRRHRVISPD